jgi:hypothetical protein
MDCKKLKKLDNGMYYLEVEDEIVQSFLEKNSKRALATIGTFSFHCAFMRFKDGGHYIMIGSKTCKALKIKENDEIEVVFSEDTSDYQFEMPEEFQEVLYQDLVALSVFEDLTDGNKRGLIYVVSSVKSSDKRIERALKVCEKLKLGITSPRLVLK